jgi:sphinganine C4-monooxygenase
VSIPFVLSRSDLTVIERFFIDTWQYFFHRLMHANKFLYRNLHSVHHRLYVPYAFGALYNHPVEGFLLDSMGSVIAQSLSCMTTRQAILLFTFATCKTVDDHCGYNFPYDLFQMFSGNNSDYHDIHHQVRPIICGLCQTYTEACIRSLDSNLTSLNLSLYIGMSFSALA